MKNFLEQLQGVAMCLDQGGEISEDETTFLQSLDSDAISALIELSGFAKLKLRANACRLSGDIETAQMFEHRAELHYKRLPQNYKW